MGCPIVVGVLLISCLATLCAAQSHQEVSSEEKGPLQQSMNKMAIFQEDPCNRQGGQCMVRDLCPEGKLDEDEELCPYQKSNDVRCCYAAARSADTGSVCENMGGQCLDSCGRNIQMTEAEDCSYDSKVCCALV